MHQSARSRAEAQVATLYGLRRHEPAPTSAALLTEDQHYLLVSHERIFDHGYRYSIGLLRDVVAGKADFLRSVTVPFAGGLSITSGADGLFRVWDQH